MQDSQLPPPLEHPPACPWPVGPLSLCMFNLSKTRADIKYGKINKCGNGLQAGNPVPLPCRSALDHSPGARGSVKDGSGWWGGNQVSTAAGDQRREDRRAGGRQRGVPVGPVEWGVMMPVWTALACLPVPWESRTKANHACELALCNMSQFSIKPSMRCFSTSLGNGTSHLIREPELSSKGRRSHQILKPRVCTQAALGL